MDYEKKYEEALERAKAGKPMDEVFPELKESEEERIRKHCIWMLKGCLAMEDGLFDKEKVKADIAWLEKQKEQKYTNSEKPKEWSEEDEEHINSILERLEGMCKKGATFTQTRFAVSEDKDWLKSLRPQPHWKPSEEQMEALNTAIETFERNDLCAGELVTLLLDLKKL